MVSVIEGLLCKSYLLGQSKVYPNQVPSYRITESFQAKKTHKFCVFVAIRKSFLREIWGEASFGVAKASNLQKFHALTLAARSYALLHKVTRPAHLSFQKVTRPAMFSPVPGVSLSW